MKKGKKLKKKNKENKENKKNIKVSLDKEYYKWYHNHDQAI
jgi:hypothetical protein